MTYAVVWSENNGPERAGRLELTEGAVRLSGTGEGERDAQLTLRYPDLTEVYLERSAPAKHAWNPALVLVDRAGDSVAIGSLQGLGALQAAATT